MNKEDARSKQNVLSLECSFPQAYTEMNDGLSTCDQPGVSYISVLALKELFDIYLYFSLNDPLLISVIPLALFR